MQRAEAHRPTAAPGRRARRATLTALAATLVLGCSGGDPAGVATSQPVDTLATSTTVRRDDGVFQLGLVVPQIGSGADLGASVETAVTLAAAEINAAGGIAGQRIRLVVRNEGENPAAALLSVQELVRLDVDAIIGPTSSLDTLAALATATEAGVLTCSPTASALALDRFPDSNLFIRTIPSDSLQAEAIATVVDEAGSARPAVVYLDDPYGRPFAEAVERALRAAGVVPRVVVGFSQSEQSIAAAVTAIVDVLPDVIVVIADSSSGPVVVDAIDASSPPPRPTFVVNDAMRRPDSSARPYSTSLSARVRGVSPLTYTTDEAFLTSLREIDLDATGLYAHSAYDCLNVIALGAAAAGSTSAPAISSSATIVTDGGTSCRSYAACLELLRAGRNIDYDGPTGALVIGTDGDPDAAVFEEYTYDDTGRDITVRRFVVGER